MLNKISFH